MIVGFGSAHIDILASVTGDPTTKDRVGKVAMDIGGTGGNVAVNCSALGVPTRFVTALNGSAHSRIIVEHLERAGVEVLVHEDRELPMAAFVAQIGATGDMESAISCMPVERVTFSDAFLTQAFEGAELVYADCNLSVDMLAVLSQRCTQWGIPFFIAGVSEEKTLRAVQVLRNGGACDGLFLNRREADYVKKHVHDMHPRASVISKTLEDMNFGEYLRCKVVITEGAEGAVLVEDSQIYRVRAPTVEGVRTLLGAGDAFMAGTLVHFVQERSTLYRALDRAALTAADVVTRDNCSLAESQAIDKAIDFFHDSARKDGLTQIFNRTTTSQFGEKLLAKSWKTGRPFAAIILDIDHFKNVNDTWGHPVGDEVIKGVAAVVQQAMRESDVAGRWGGEEFVCLLANADEEVAVKVAERIRCTVEQTIHHPRPITVSVGVSIADGPAEEPVLKDLIGRADEALYASKQTGRNRVSVWRPTVAAEPD